MSCASPALGELKHLPLGAADSRMKVGQADRNA
jgi:hypothetical protein